MIARVALDEWEYRPRPHLWRVHLAWFGYFVGAREVAAGCAVGWWKQCLVALYPDRSRMVLS